MAEREDPVHYIKAILKRIQFLEGTLEDHVDAMCQLLQQKAMMAIPNVPEDRQLSSKTHLKDIYWSLKLHLLFHVGEDVANHHANLRKLGENLGLGEEELNQLPGRECAIDPGTKFLEFLSDISESPGRPKGSFEHAREVKEKAGEAFRTYLIDIRGKRNIFRPKVLALVSRGLEYFVGSSMAVSNFLRPLCLNERIVHFKPSLKRAIIRFEPLRLDPAEGILEGWSSSAFDHKDYQTTKVPCQKCQTVFSSLDGFIGNNDLLANAGGNTFLGACAEYCPANNLLPGGDGAEMLSVMREHMAQCETFFRSYRNIRNLCDGAYSRYQRDNSPLRDVYHEVRPIVHIFGFIPECQLAYCN